MSRLIKIGLTGLAITLLILVVLAVAFGVSPATVSPLLMPWTVLVLIGLTNRKK